MGRRFRGARSVSGRLWFRPRDYWEFQLSSGRLKEPEELGHGDIVRTTASASWLKHDGDNFHCRDSGVRYEQRRRRESRSASVWRPRSASASYSTVTAAWSFVEVETGVLIDDHSVGHEVKDRESRRSHWARSASCRAGRSSRPASAPR